MIHKFYAIKDEKSINTGTVISTIFAIVVSEDAYFLEVLDVCLMEKNYTMNPE